MQLSPHFTLNEFLRSEAADQEGIAEQYTPPELVIVNLKRLCEKALEPLRAKLNAHFKQPIAIHISSGYRCEKLNKLVGGVRDSQHLIGCAADIHVPGLTPQELFDFIRTNLAEYDQCIQEFNQWVHLSYAGYGNRNMDLIATMVNRRAQYRAA